MSFYPISWPFKLLLSTPARSPVGGAALAPYKDRLLTLQSANLLALWPLDETSGTTADNYEGTAARDGTHTGVTLNNTTAPDGSPAAFYDGSTSYTDVYSTSFRDAFNGAEGTVMIWGKVFNAGVWTDGNTGIIVKLRNDNSNLVDVYKAAGNNTMNFRRAGTGVQSAVTPTNISYTDWMHVAFSWSISNNEVIAYINGVSIGSNTCTGGFTGSLRSNSTIIGSDDTTPTQPFHGWLSHAAVWNSALVDPQIKELYDQATLAYKDTLLNTANSDLLALWLLNETSGTTADNYEGTAARDGTTSGATVGVAGGPDGDTVYSFDGVNDYVDVYSADLAGVFDGDEGAFSAWVKVSAVGVWTDGNLRTVGILRYNVNNFILIRKETANNTLTFYQKAGGTQVSVQTTVIDTTDWFHIAMSWSATDDAVVAYIDGVKIGTVGTLGAYSGDLDSSTTVIGASSDTPANLWSGDLARPALWAKPLNSREINYHWFNALQSPTYAQKLQTLAPDNLLAIWPLTETSGTDALDSTPHGRNGTHTGVTLNNTTAPDGSPAPFYDGTNDYTDVYSVSFRDAFNGAEGTVMIWAKVFNSGVWTDGAARNMFRVLADGSNYIILTKPTGNNQLQTFYVAGGTSEFNSHTSISTTDWFHLAVTWSATGDKSIVYFNGSDLTTNTGLGVWAGLPGSTTTVLGAKDTVPTQTWHGWLSHPIVHSTALQPSEILWAYEQATA